MKIDIRTGECLEILRGMADESVDCVVTSPPYYKLRDYETASWVGGDDACKHVREKRGNASTIEGGNYQAREIYAEACGLCGARRIDMQIGLEATPEEFIDRLVIVFREVRRVLKAEGTLWLNIGDTYASTGGIGRQGGTSARAGRANVKAQMKRDTTRPPEGYKAKDLIGIPWMLAFALRADGWYLRQEIIWHKPNPMPESAKDRCTKAHESIFLLAKSPRYYFDQDAILEPASPNTHARMAQNGLAAQKGSITPSKHNGPMKPVGRKFDPGEASKNKNNPSFHAAMMTMPTHRNKRSVWTVQTMPCPEAHFATFPPDLIVPCIKAGCPEGGTVLDPFGGAGTTGLVADRLRRNAILIELNPGYADIARRRIAADRADFPMLEAMGA